MVMQELKVYSRGDNVNIILKRELFRAVSSKPHLNISSIDLDMKDWMGPIKTDPLSPSRTPGSGLH